MAVLNEINGIDEYRNNLIFLRRSLMINKEVNNLVVEIPKRAYLNAEIVQNMRQGLTLDNSIKLIEDKYNLKDYVFMNQAYIVSLLYSLIVVPKEVWQSNNASDRSKKIRDRINIELSEFNLDKYFEINTNKNHEANELINIIIKLRNAISHVNYSFDSNLNFEFWDMYNGQINFEAKITSNNLMKFLTIVGSVLANMN